MTSSSERASDQIWGIVCGFPEPYRSGRLLLMLKAYIDDSNMGQGAVSVLAGWVAPAQRWATFSDDWSEILRMKPRVDHFKWNEALGLGGEFLGISERSRDEKINLLINCIADHNPLGFSVAMPNDAYQAVFADLPDGTIKYPYFLSFYSIIAFLSEYLESVGTSDKVDFIFDTQPDQMPKVLAAWKLFLEVAPSKVKHILGDPPSFRNDKLTVPLQAADLIAGWMREQAEAVYYGREPRDPLWGKRAESLLAIGRYWTREMMQKLRDDLSIVGAS